MSIADSFSVSPPSTLLAVARRIVLGASALALVLGLGGCSDAAAGAEGTGGGGGSSGTGGSSLGTGGEMAADSGAGGESPSDPSPVYALMSQVYSDDDRTVYVLLTDTLDPTSVSLDGAREFPGVANLAAVGGRLLISSGEEPSITEFHISDDLTWEKGETVSFVNYPLEDNANFYYQFILDDHTAYLPYEASKRVIWDPTDMEIDGEMDDSSLEFEKGGLQLTAGGNRNAVRFDGPVMQAFFYHDEDWLHYGEESLVVQYDPETHQETAVQTMPCPGLSLATQDEEGYTYYSTWGYIGALALFDEGPAPCVARLKPDLTVDEDWTTDLTDVTDGRYVNNFRYIGNGKALANVLHHEELDADFSGPFDPTVMDGMWETGPHWQFWIFDLEDGTGHRVVGVDVEVGSGAQFAVLDGRTFAFVPFDDWGRTKVYELDAEGVATEHFEIVGDVFKWIQVR